MAENETNMTLGRFCDFQSDRTPPKPMNLLCISMVWGAFGRPGVRRGWFSISHKTFKESHKIDEMVENL